MLYHFVTGIYTEWWHPLIEWIIPLAILIPTIIFIEWRLRKNLYQPSPCHYNENNHCVMFDSKLNKDTCPCVYYS